MKVKHRRGLIGGVILLSTITFVSRWPTPNQVFDREKIDTKPLQVEATTEQLRAVSEIASVTEEKLPTTRVKINDEAEIFLCDGEPCEIADIEVEDTSEIQPEGMLITIEVGNTLGHRAIVSSQLCSIYSYLDEDDLAEFEIFQSCDIFVYRMDGAFRSYTEEYFVDYIEGGEAELSFEFPTKKIGGMGVSIQKIEDGFEILHVFPDTPADELGLERGDIIVEVNGETTYNLSFDDFLQLTTGYEGTKAEFRLQRDQKNQPPHIFIREAKDYN